MAALSPQEPRIVLPREFVNGKIGVVTVTFGSGGVLEDFLASLDCQTYRNFCLIAVDNGSKDDTVEQLKAYRGCECFVIANGQNLGVAAGNNQGIRAAIDAGCEYVLLLNNDVVFGPGLFQQLVDGLSEHNCQMTTPLIYYHAKPDVIWAAGGNFQWMYGYRCIHYSLGEEDHGQHFIPQLVTHTPTCCVLVQRKVFQVIGLMDERYFVYGDDNDFMFRAWKADILLFFLPEAKLWHKVGSLTGTESPFSMRYVARNKAYFMVKHLGRFITLPYMIVYWFYYVMRCLVGKDSRDICKLKIMSWNEGFRMRP